MRIEFCGAARDVTGSQYLLDVNGHRFLMECGMYQGHRADAYDRNLTFRYDIRSVEAVILSHAHIDHSVPWKPSSGKLGSRISQSPPYTTPWNCR
jgi:metallo-beta-lactamase family protein